MIKAVALFFVALYFSLNFYVALLLTYPMHKDYLSLLDLLELVLQDLEPSA